MSAPHIDEVLALVGRLDDSTVDDPPRDRFRAYLLENVTDVALLRDYIDQCREQTDEQHVRAVRDLVNHFGRLMGFEVVFGPYEWLPGQVGFDGRWTSPWGLHIVVEVKSRETFAAQRPSLARTIEQLIDDGVIPNWNLALGLYAVTHPGVQINHLEKAILDEKQTHQIRIITPESLFVLAELSRSGKLSEQDVLTLLRSSSPTTDWLVELVSRLAGGIPAVEPVEEPAAEPVEELAAEPVEEPAAEPVEEPVEEPAEEPVEEAAEEPVEELAEEPVEEPAAEAVEEPASVPAAEFGSFAQGLGEVLECFGNCLVKTLELLTGKKLQ